MIKLCQKCGAEMIKTAYRTFGGRIEEVWECLCSWKEIITVYDESADGGNKRGGY